MDSLRLQALRQMRIANVKHAIELLENARDALRLAQSQTAALGVNHTDCGDAAKQIDAMLFRDQQRARSDQLSQVRGTLNGTAVYAREVVREALRHNASAVAFYHNHPSGVSEPSRADELLTQRLKEACSLVEIRVLDHIITGGDSHMSFAERGLL